jgi:hypothetical protein
MDLTSYVTCLLAEIRLKFTGQKVAFPNHSFFVVVKTDI